MAQKSKDTILVVDDNREIGNLWVHKILPAMGYDTLLARDGNTALKMLKTYSVSLILVDYQLPDMTGVDILKAIDDDGMKIPSILVTAHGSEQIVVDALRHGATDYLTKPVSEEQLKVTLERILSAARLQREKAQLTAQLNEQLASISVLAKVGKSVTASLNLNEVLKRIVEAGVLLTHAEEGFLALLDPGNNQLLLRAAKNIDQEKVKTMRIPVEDNLVGEALETRKPIRTTSANAGAEPIKVVTGYLVRSLLYVPIVARDKAVGVLTVVNMTNQRPFKEKDETLLLSLADYAAIAIENASLFEKTQLELKERMRVEEALRESEERYALAVNGANDGLWDWNLRTNQIYYSPRWKSMLGYEEDDIENTPNAWFKCVHPQDIERLKLDIAAHLDRTTTHFENEHRMQHKDGSYRWILSRGLAVWDGTGFAHRIAGSISDITDRKYAEDKLLHDAFYDKLTGLPNRALFLDHLGLAVERTKRRPDNKFAVLFLDLDRFKDINDSHGHLLGDQLLISVAKLLGKRLRSTDTVARFGGDEFVILLDDINDIDNATQIAGWILSELTSPFNIAGHEMYISASIGIVIGVSGYQRPDDVLRDADIAMYHAKANGKARFEIFYPSMRVRIMERLEMENDLRQAIERRELQVHYQIIVSLVTGEVAGFEALVRWNHPHRGLMPPKDFIPLAEETGLIIPMDRFVLVEACQQLRSWQNEKPAFAKLTISVNISGKHASQPDLYDFVAKALQETSLNPSCLKLEITESSLMENLDASEKTFGELRKLGVQIQIDDFGIGYSSLSYLSKFPINALKIDRSFVMKMTEESNNLKIVQAVVQLSHRLGVGVIAEGVETKAQLQQLKTIGCEYGQGFYVAMPLPIGDVKNMLVNPNTGETNLHILKFENGS